MLREVPNMTIKPALALGVAVLATCVASGTADARRARCAMPDEMAAVQAAAVQQELMVAALTCNEVSRFNAFQTGFGPDLRLSDARLAQMFRRLYGPRRGEAAYHAFKTKLANDSSMRSIRNHPVYCQEAGAILDAALTADRRPALVSVVGTVNAGGEERPVQLCGLKPARRVRARHH
jgi:hypothetical protein